MKLTVCSTVVTWPLLFHSSIYKVNNIHSFFKIARYKFEKIEKKIQGKINEVHSKSHKTELLFCISYYMFFYDRKNVFEFNVNKDECIPSVKSEQAVGTNEETKLLPVL